MKQPNLPLEQITRRLVELSLDYDQMYTTRSSKKSMFPKLALPYKMNDTLAYKELQLDSDFTLSTLKSSNSWFLSIDNNIVMMKYALKNEEIILIYGVAIKNKETFFNYPVSSDRLHIFKTDSNTNSIQSYELKDVKSKLICLSFDAEFVFMPLLPTLKKYLISRQNK